MLEVIAALFSLASVYLTAKKNKFCWLVGIIGILAYFLVFINNKLYADAFIQVIFIIQSINAWFNWSDKDRHVSKLDIYGYMTSILFASVICYFLHNFTIYYNGSCTIVDSVASSLSIVAMFLMGIKKIEAWFVWMIVDILLINIFLYKQLYLSSLVYSIFLILCIKGFLNWKKDIKIV